MLEPDSVLGDTQKRADFIVEYQFVATAAKREVERDVVLKDAAIPHGAECIVGPSDRPCSEPTRLANLVVFLYERI